MPVKLSSDSSASEVAVEHTGRLATNGESSKATPIYTCPMHPEVRQDHPGNCPKCGMTLELRTVAPGSDNQESSELLI